MKSLKPCKNLQDFRLFAVPNLGESKTMNERKAAGRAVISHKEQPVVPADIISLLSGVNFGSVEKVLAALHAIREYAGTTPSSLIDVYNVPLQRVDVTDSGDAKRAAATEQLLEDLIAAGPAEEVERTLGLRLRFPYIRRNRARAVA
jgi:hypothetical protein